MITVELIFALDAQQIWRRMLSLPKGATIEQALTKSGFYQEQPTKWHDAPCGVFGVQRQRDHPLQDNDQVEVYRPLVFDPMESRRRRAAHKARQRAAKEGERRQPSAAAQMILNR